MAQTFNRRWLLAGGAAAALGVSVLGRYGAASQHGRLLLAACNDDAGQHWIAGWRIDRSLAFRLAVPCRAHAMAVVPGQRRAIFFSRRPGRLSWLVDLDRGRIDATLESADGRHFYGHGVFSRDGRYLYTTENDYDRARGVLGVYDASDGYRRIRELDTGGIGPHELALLGDGTTLAIANGGIRTHPDSDRDKLNVDTMQPSLAYLDRRDGRLLGQLYPEDHQMSIRHLAVAADDRVVMGVQYQGDAARIVPLVLTHRGEPELIAATATLNEWRSHRNYIASVAVSADSCTALVAAPRGDTVSLWDLPGNRLQARLAARDVAGAGYLAERDEFLVTSGLGQVYAIPPHATRPQREFADNALHWDNHLAFA